MGKTRPLRGLALIAVIPLAIALFASIGYGQGPVVTYGYGGFGAFPRFATENSQYYLRVTYDRNGNHDGDPVLAFQLQNRPTYGLTSMGTINLLAFLRTPSAVGYNTGIQPSPWSSTLLSNVPSLTTADGPDAATVIGSYLDGWTGRYNGDPIRITSGPVSGEQSVISNYQVDSRSGTATDDALPFVSSTTTNNGAADTLIDNTLGGVDGQFVGAQIIITSGAQSGQASNVTAYVASTGTLTVSPNFGGAIAAGVNYEIHGYSLVDTTLAEPSGYWDGALVRIQSGTAAGQTAVVASWDATTHTFLFRTPFQVKITTGVQYTIQKVTITVSPAFSQPVPIDSSFEILVGVTGRQPVPPQYDPLLRTGIMAEGKIIVDAEDDVDRDGQLTPPPFGIDNPPNGSNRPDLYVWASTTGTDTTRFTVGPLSEEHGLRAFGDGSRINRTWRAYASVQDADPPAAPAEFFGADQTVSICGSHNTNREWLAWNGVYNLGDPDPLSLDPPNTASSGNEGTNTADDGHGATNYTFQVIYRHWDGLPPRFGWDVDTIWGGPSGSDVPSFQGTLEIVDGRIGSDRRDNSWFYTDTDNRWQDGACDHESGVALIIDNDYANPHFMVAVDANGNELNIDDVTVQQWQQGVRFVYQVLPTDYSLYRTSTHNVTGRPANNGYVDFANELEHTRNVVDAWAFTSMFFWDAQPLRGQATPVGFHSYQFITSDDVMPPLRQPDVHVARPSVRSFNREFTPPERTFSPEIGRWVIATDPGEDVAGIPGDTRYDPVDSTRWNESVRPAIGGAWGYSIDSLKVTDEEVIPWDQLENQPPDEPPNFIIRNTDPILHAPEHNPQGEPAGHSWPLFTGNYSYPTNDATIFPNFWDDYPNLTPGPGRPSVTDASGAPDGSTLVDSTLGGIDDQFIGGIVRITDPTSGAFDERRRIWDYDAATGTMYVQHIPTTGTPTTDNFSAQISAGTQYLLETNRWLQSDTFTFQIWYTSSFNRPPLRMELLVRREGSIGPGDGTTDPATVSAIYPMTKVDPTDNDFTDGVLYYVSLSPTNLKPPIGPASNSQVDDFQYYFRASDGVRTTWFPRRPERVDPITNRVFSMVDGADFGVNVNDANNDYYFFRVNTPPQLANGRVAPNSARPGVQFTYNVDYSDIDGAFRVNFGNPLGVQGDRPFRTDLNIDTFGDRDGLLRVVGPPVAGGPHGGWLVTYQRVDGQNITYTGDGSVTTMPGGTDTSGVVDELVRAPTTGMRGRELKLESDANSSVGRHLGDPPLLVLANTTTNPGSDATAVLEVQVPAGFPGQPVSDGDTFTITDWVTATMNASNPSDVDYTTPNDYLFQTGTQIEMTAGQLHEYFFEFADDHGTWLYPGNENFRREGQIVRLPQAGGVGSPDNYIGPEVLPNQSPVVGNFTFSPDPSPVGPGNDARPGDNADCNTATSVTIRMTYLDPDNDPPVEIFLGLDGTPETPAQILDVTEQDPNDTLYSDGKVYQATLRLDADLDGHVIRGRASDGALYYPVDPLDPAKRPFTDPGDPDPDPVTGEARLNPNGPIVVANNPPRLFFPSVDPPDGSAPAFGTNENPAPFPADLGWPTGGFPPDDYVLVEGRAHEGMTTGPGLPDGSTLVDGGAPPGHPTYGWTGAVISILSGDAKGMSAGVVSFAGGTFTVDPPFTDALGSPVQIVAGVDYEVFFAHEAPGLELEGNWLNAQTQGTPDVGASSDNYTYRVIYFDPDTFGPTQLGNPPDYVNLVIDGGVNQSGGSTVMAKVDPSDVDYTDGVMYEVTIPGGAPILGAGSPHSFYFETRDGLDIARLPSAPSTEPGPIVDDPPGAPTNLSALDYTPDQGGRIDLAWNRSSDDGVGFDDVDYYSVRRRPAGSLDPIDDINPLNPLGHPRQIVLIPATAIDPYRYSDRLIPGDPSQPGFGAVHIHAALTTADGSAAQDTLIDSTLPIPTPNVWDWVGATVEVLPGTPSVEASTVTGYDPGTGTLTVAPAFSAQVLAGTPYRVYKLEPVERLGQDPETGQPIVTSDYEYAVVALDSNDDGSTRLGAASNIASARPADNIAPSAPTPMGCLPQADGSIVVNWTLPIEDPTVLFPPAEPSPPVGDIVGYRVYRDEVTPVVPGGGSPTLVLLANENGTGLQSDVLGPGVSSLVDNTAVLATTYYYLVRSVDLTQESANATSTTGCTAEDTAPPAFTDLLPQSCAPVDADVQFTVDDPGSGVDTSTIQITVVVNGGTPIVVDQTDTRVSVVAIPGSSAYDVAFNLDPLGWNFQPGDNVDVTAEADDLSGVHGTVNWSFEVEQLNTVTGEVQLLQSDGVTPLLVAATIPITMVGPNGSFNTTATTSVATGHGTYAITDVPGGQYNITASLPGAVWNPPGTTATVAFTCTNDAVGADDVLEGTVMTYVTGQISDHFGNAVPGVTVTAQGLDPTNVFTAVTQADGTYMLSGLADDTYTFTPTLTGFTFEPPSQTGIVITSPGGAIGVDFKILFTISGQVTDSLGNGMAGVTVDVVGANYGDSGSATTQADGTYTITDLAADDYTVTPSLTGSTFNPPSRVPVRVDWPSGNATGIDFEILFSISGKVADAEGNGLVGVRIDVLGQNLGDTGLDTTIADGTYSITGLQADTYTLTLTKPTGSFFTFSPPSRDDVRVDVFRGSATDTDFECLFEITGAVTRQDNGAPLEGAVVTADGPFALTGPTGVYTIEGVTGGDRTVLPALANFTFSPASRQVQATVPAAADGRVEDVDFEAVPILFTISGVVSLSGPGDFSGLAINMEVSGGPSTPDPVPINPVTGVYIITDLEAGDYDVTPVSTTGLAQFEPVSRAITLGPSQTGVNFTAYRVFTGPFRTGLQLVGVPYTPMDPNLQVSHVMGTTAIWRWDPAGPPPRYLFFGNPGDASDPLFRVRPGNGYFVAFPPGPRPEVPGTPVPVDRNFVVPLYGEWNMLANPYTVAFAWNTVVQSSPFVEDFAWVYLNDGLTAGYVLVTDTPTLNTLAVVHPYWGFWQRVQPGQVGATISIPPPSTVVVQGGPDKGAADEGAAVAPASRAATADGWALQVAASAGNVADNCNYLGVGAPAGLPAARIDNPPVPTGNVDVYFPGEAVGEPGRRLAADIRPAGAGAQSWSFVVSTDLANTDITVSLPNIAELPKNLQVVLTDVDSGEALFARTRNQYVYNSGGTPGERHFRVDVGPALAGDLQITGLTVAPLRGPSGAGAQISYTLSAPAATTVRIFNLAGQVIATVEADVTRAAGLTTTTWDGRADFGTIVPAGTYLVKVDARSEDGRKASSQSMLPVAR